MLSLDELRWRLAEKGYRNRSLERLLGDVGGPAISPEILDQVEQLLKTDCARVFRTWFGEREYRKHLNLATVQCAQGAVSSILDYLRRQG
jgi:hypothetical protein